MDYFLGQIAKILGAVGLEDKTMNLITIGFALASMTVVILRKVITYFYNKRQNERLVKDLHPFYTRQEVEDATRYYIPTQYQNITPTEDDEPGRSHIAAARNPLLPLFLKKAFHYSGDDNKYYLVLYPFTTHKKNRAIFSLFFKHLQN